MHSALLERATITPRDTAHELFLVEVGDLHGTLDQGIAQLVRDLFAHPLFAPRRGTGASTATPATATLTARTISRLVSGAELMKSAWQARAAKARRCRHRVVAGNVGTRCRQCFRVEGTCFTEAENSDPHDGTGSPEEIAESTTRIAV